MLRGVLTVVALSFVAIPWSFATEIDDRRAELDRLKKALEENRARLADLEKKEAEQTRRQEGLERDRQLTQQYLQQLETQNQSLRQVQEEHQLRLIEREVSLTETGDRLKDRLVQYYKLRHVKGGELLLSATSFNQVFARSQFLRRMITRDRVDLLALAQERAQIAHDAVGLEERRAEIESLHAEKRKEEERLSAQGASLLKELAGTRKSRTTEEKRLAELEASEKSIRALLTQLEKARQRGAGPDFGGDFGAHRGQLRWPVEGRVVAEFGFEVHPKYGTKVPQNGIVIAAPDGTDITATADGVVEFVDWYDGYGRTVILNHGSGYYSLYAHASAVLVRRGDRVDAGTVIAKVGDTDSIRGSCLHFELRHREEALNPRQWLRAG